MNRPKVKPDAGPKCKHCTLAIERYTVKSNGVRAEFKTWVHKYTSNVWCQTNLVGATAKFAEPS